MTGARETALYALERCRRGGAWSDSVLDGLIKDASLSPRDAALCQRLCYGVQQNRMLLDYYIGCYSRTPSRRLEPKLLDILRISAYQLLFMDKIPPSAAVSEGVGLCRKCGLDRAAGLCNAVLRRISENRNSLPDIPGKGTSAFLSVKYSHPQWLAEEFMSRLGYDGAEALLEADNSIPDISLQVNTLKISAEALLDKLISSGARAEMHPWLPNCIALKNSGSVAALPGFNDGEFYVQDAAARLAVTAAALKPGMRVLDACSAPGGKSFAAAVDMADRGRIQSCDIHKNKLSRVASGAGRMGFGSISTLVMDAKQPDPEFFGQFGVVLADAPCSGLGVIRRKPEIRYKPETELDGLPQVQLDILRGLAGCVAEGGLLVYSTCTLREKENEGVSRAFLSEHPEFTLEDFELPQGACAGVHNGMVTLWPHLSGTDGFFICRMRRTKQI